MSIDLSPAVETNAPSASLADDYQQVRRFSAFLCEPLVAEDYVIQSMPDVSPTRWHLAHTTWFFETFVLAPHAPGYQPFHPRFGYLFNSYYVQAGERFTRSNRGLLSRPTVAEIYDYRAHVDKHVLQLLTSGTRGLLETIAPLVEIGLHHEQQHQELMLTDIKHVFSLNPLNPVYRPYRKTSAIATHPLEWISLDEGLVEIGHCGEGFAYDNEGPRHRHYLAPFQLASRLVTNEEYIAFLEDGGYERPTLWLSMGWATVEAEGWKAPMYWEQHDGQWWQYTLNGLREVIPQEPVCHLSYFEADAFARWSGCRLPTEQEWETAAQQYPYEGNFVDEGHYHTRPSAQGDSQGLLHQLYGEVWEWTQSPYAAYPGYRPAPGALGEYNGKFMCNQFVLRGGSCATSQSHIRSTYRNFFPPETRWQFTGLRLAKDGA